MGLALVQGCESLVTVKGRATPAAVRDQLARYPWPPVEPVPPEPK
jgi:hypothetical protein